MYTTSALGIANDANITEILREAGPQVCIYFVGISPQRITNLCCTQGLHIREIGKRSGTDPDKIGTYSS
jgi:hypothetical protein